MCNANHHSPGCMCGFGGEGHLGGGGRWGSGSAFGNAYSFGRNTNKTEKLYPSFESFVNPNAECPVCGEEVFYYQSPDGGKVFFDALGPPWPKHPCTDNINDSLSNYRKNDLQKRISPWQSAGWSPFIVNHIYSDNDLIKINGKSEKYGEIELFFGKDNDFPEKSSLRLFHINQIDTDSFELSTFILKEKESIFIEELCFVGHTNKQSIEEEKS